MATKSAKKGPGPVKKVGKALQEYGKHYGGASISGVPYKAPAAKATKKATKKGGK